MSLQGRSKRHGWKIAWQCKLGPVIGGEKWSSMMQAHDFWELKDPSGRPSYSSLVLLFPYSLKSLLTKHQGLKCSYALMLPYCWMNCARSFNKNTSASCQMDQEFSWSKLIANIHVSSWILIVHRNVMFWVRAESRDSKRVKSRALARDFTPFRFSRALPRTPNATF